jgi:hypothetical protein
MHLSAWRSSGDFISDSRRANGTNITHDKVSKKRGISSKTFISYCFSTFLKSKFVFEEIIARILPPGERCSGASLRNLVISSPPFLPPAQEGSSMMPSLGR